MRKLLCITSLLLLVGCSAKSEEVITCKGELAGAPFTSTLEKNGEFVGVEEIEMEFPYKTLGLDGDALEKKAEEQYAALNDYDGVSATIDRTDEVISLILSVDYREADVEQLSKDGVLPITPGKGENEPNEISYKLVKKSYEDAGLTCSIDN